MTKNRKSVGRVEIPGMLESNWTDAVTRPLVQSFFDIMDKQSHMLCEEDTHQLMAEFIGCFIGAAVYKTLYTGAATEGTQAERAKRVIAAFKNAKSLFEEAVAAGFSGGMASFSKKPIEYYCQVRVVPEPKGSKVN